MSKKNILEDADYQALQAKLNSPNYFLCSGIMRHEIRHSNFIAWLLNLGDTHSQGNLFLNAFLESINEKIKNPTAKIDIPNTSVGFEIFRESKHNIDIFIKYEKTILVIENKIQATDSPEQLFRYRTHVNDLYKNHKISFIYWTLTGEDPTDLKEKDLWHLYSYEDFVRVLEATLTKVQDTKVAMYIEDYIEALEITHLKNGKYAKNAKRLFERYKNDLSKIFNNDTKYRAQDKLTLDLIKNNSPFVRGDGFFAHDQPYLEEFEKNCGLYNYSVREGNSTFFSLSPREGDKIWSYFGIRFRFYEKTNSFSCIFGVDPETTDNKTSRDLILAHRDKFYGLENKADNITGVNKPGAKDHIGLVKRKIEFNPLTVAPEDLGQKIHDIFKNEIVPFTEKISKVVSSIGKLG
jgi:hypothetical protein